DSPDDAEPHQEKRRRDPVEKPAPLAAMAPQRVRQQAYPEVEEPRAGDGGEGRLEGEENADARLRQIGPLDRDEGGAPDGQRMRDAEHPEPRQAVDDRHLGDVSPVA